MPLILALRRQGQVDLCEFEASLDLQSKFQNRLQSYRVTLSQKNKNKKYIYATGILLCTNIMGVLCNKSSMTLFVIAEDGRLIDAHPWDLQILVFSVEEYLATIEESE